MKEFFKNISISVITILLSILFLEGFGHAYLIYFADTRINYEQARVFKDKPEIFRTDLKNPEYFVSDYFPTRYYEGEDDLRGKRIKRVKDPNSYRIFSLGGSSTAGSPFGHWASFSRFIEDYLNNSKLDPNFVIEVMNFGVSGFGTSRIRFIAEDILKFEPDLIIIYSGHNEHCDHYELIKNNNIVDSFSSFATIRAARHLTSKFSKREIPSEPFAAEACRIKQNLKLNRKTSELLDTQYKDNLTAIIKLAARSNTKVLLLSQLVNHYSPPAFSQEEEFSIIENKISAALNVLDTKLVLHDADKLSLLDNSNPWPYYAKGILSVKNKEYDAAKNFLKKAIQYDKSARRFRSSYHKILKDLAQEHKNTYFIDAARHAEEYLNDKIADGRLVVDLHHPTITGQALIADAVIKNFLITDLCKKDIFKCEEGKFTIPKEIVRYPKICERYLNIPDWQECISKLKKQAEEGFIEERRLNGVLEHKFFYGSGNLVNSDLAKENLFTNVWTR